MTELAGFDKVCIVLNDGLHNCEVRIGVIANLITCSKRELQNG